MPVEVQLAAGAGEQPDPDRIAVWADAVIEYSGDRPETTDICIRVVGEDEAQALNATYRGKDKPTNVLSFAAAVEGPAQRVMGDLVICMPVVSDEAGCQHKAVESHFAHMVVHGMLHLYGYDHESATDADVMEGIEREILGSLGISDPYETR